MDELWKRHRDRVIAIAESQTAGLLEEQRKAAEKAEIADRKAASAVRMAKEALGDRFPAFIQAMRTVDGEAFRRVVIGEIAGDAVDTPAGKSSK